jgi:hypothetical protein
MQCNIIQQAAAGGACEGLAVFEPRGKQYIKVRAHTNIYNYIHSYIYICIQYSAVFEPRVKQYNQMHAYTRALTYHTTPYNDTILYYYHAVLYYLMLLLYCFILLFLCRLRVSYNYSTLLYYTVFEP